MPLLVILTSPTVKPLLWSMPKVTMPSALLVATVRPFSPLSVRVLTLPSVSSLPTVMALVSVLSPSFLTLKVCRAVPAVPLVLSSFSCSSVLASSNAFLLMASVSCIASPTLEMALPPALMPLSLISTSPTFSLVWSRYGLLSSSEPASLAKPTWSLVM